MEGTCKGELVPVKHQAPLAGLKARAVRWWLCRRWLHRCHYFCCCLGRCAVTSLCCMTRLCGLSPSSGLVNLQVCCSGVHEE